MNSYPFLSHIIFLEKKFCFTVGQDMVFVVFLC